MLEIRNVSKIYRSKTGDEVKALDNVSISFPETGMVFILGKSGSGKSTLLNVMGGLDSYDGGEFIIKGKSSNDFVGSDFDAYRNTFIGFIFQEYNVLDDFTVGANIGLALELQGKKATDEAVNGILEQVDLLNYAKRKPNELSGGQKQRVAIARALVKDPEIIMADEPTGALDSNTGKQIFDTLKELSKTKLVLIVSHDRDFAERYADRIVELADGKIIEDVTKHEHQAERVSEGLHRINDSIFRIESGYKLTAKDLEMINAYLAKNNGDVLLSGDGRINDELRSAAGISKDGATTVFEGTVPERDIKAKKYEKDETKFIRSRLPMKNAVKMGSSGLKHKKFRLFMTILLSFISFAMFGLASSMAAYEKIEAATQSIVDTQIRAAAVQLRVRRTTTWSDGDSSTYHEDQAFNDEDIEWLKQQTGLDFYPVFTGSNRHWAGDTGFELTEMMLNYSHNDVYNGYLAGIVSMTWEQLAPTGYQLTTGRMPVADDEIVITEFMYRQFNQYGYTDGTLKIEKGKLTLDDNTATGIIGRTLRFTRFAYGGYSETPPTFKIVGVLDTKFDYDRYQALLPREEKHTTGGREDESILDTILSWEVDAARDFAFHALGFTTQNAFDAIVKLSGRYMGGSSSFGEYMSAGDKWLYLVALREAEIEGNNPDFISDYSRVAKGDVLSAVPGVKFFETGKTSLAENELLISDRKLYDMLPNRANVVFDEATFTQLAISIFGEDKWNDITVADMNYMQRMEHLSQTELGDSTAVYTRPEVIAYVGNIYGIEMPDNTRSSEISRALNFLNDFGGTEQNEYVLYDYDTEWISDMFRYDDAVDNTVWQQEKVISTMLKANHVPNNVWNDMDDAEKKDTVIDYYIARYYHQEQNTYNSHTSSELEGMRDVAFAKICGINLSDLVKDLIFEIRESTNGSSNDGTHTTLQTPAYKIVGYYQVGDKDWDTVISTELYEVFTSWQETAHKEMVGFKDDMDQPTYDVAPHVEGEWAYVIAPISADNTDAIQMLVEMTYNDGDEVDYVWSMDNSVMTTLNYFNDIIETLSQVFVWVGLGFAVFSAFLLMNFISTSISYKKREIGILRAVGARSSDVFKIFFSEAAIIAFINFLLAAIVSGVAIGVLNSIIRNLGFQITLLTFGPLQILMMLGISAVVAALASFLPVWSIAKKNPVDAIKDK